jgi:cytochrome c
VIYAEPIRIGFRIRDLVEGADGRILIWTDGAKIIVLSPGPSQAIGSVVFARCQNCHDRSGPELVGPSLKGIVGAKVARVAGYQYSPALTRLGGQWTEDRLDAFLSNPDTFAPGSVMAAGRVADDRERRALMAFLKTYK